MLSKPDAKVEYTAEGKFAGSFASPDPSAFGDIAQQTLLASIFPHSSLTWKVQVSPPITTHQGAMWLWPCNVILR